MTKADLARAVYERHGGISNKDASRLVDTILNFIKQGLLRGERVQISGFGTFLVREKRGRLGRNPQTGEVMAISPRKAVVFRPSKSFQNDVGQEG
ncbi:MAG: integration host factor subunit alpha [Acidobacteriota bacterium]